jgi:hypothetical protein
MYVLVNAWGIDRPSQSQMPLGKHFKVGVLAMQHASRNRAIVPRREKRQSSKDVQSGTMYKIGAGAGIYSNLVQISKFESAAA